MKVKIKITAKQVQKLMSQALSMYEKYVDEEESKNFADCFKDLEIEGEILW